MGWPLRYLAIGAVGFFVIGCSETGEGPPTGPNFHTVISKASACDVGHISQLANSFFVQPRQGVVKNLVDLLGTQAPYSSAAKTTGFNILAQMEGALNDVPATSTDPAKGSDLVNHLLLCMYNGGTNNGHAISVSDSLSYPETFPEDFTVSLTATTAAHGAFGERSDGTAPVFSRPVSAPYTGIAPPSGSSWQSIIPASVAPRNDPQRVVFYGSPGTPADGQTYDWRSIPHNANFNPNIIIGFCVDPGTHPTSMVLEKDVAVLSFAEAYFLTPGSCSFDLAALDLTNPLRLAHRLLRFGTGLLAPRPLMATVLLTGSGGTKSKCCSKVGPKDVPSVSATLSNVKSRIKVNTETFSITATAKSGTDFVNGTQVTLSTTVNSGTNTFIRVKPSSGSCSSGAVPVGITGSGTNLAGTYVFNNLCFTNTGNVYVIGSFDVVGRNDTPVTAKSNKINVVP
jgi:hypothetical protein